MPQYLLAMTIFGTIGLFVKFIELPSTVIALSRGALGTLGIEAFKKTYQYGDREKQLQTFSHSRCRTGT